MDSALHDLLATRLASQFCGLRGSCFNMVDQYRGHRCALGRYKSLLGLASIGLRSCRVFFLYPMALSRNLAV